MQYLKFLIGVLLFKNFYAISLSDQNVNANSEIWNCDYETYSCYAISDSYMYFQEALQFCSRIGSIVTSVTSAKENNYIRSLCGRNQCWLGLIDFVAEKEDMEFWIDGSPYSYAKGYHNWHVGEPNNHGGQHEQLTVMNLVSPHGQLVDGTWFDIGETEARAVCKVSYPWIKKVHDLYGTMKQRFWYCNELTKSCFMIDYSPKTFRDAKSHCKDFGSTLTSITSSEENDYIAQICGFYHCWIGLKEDSRGYEQWLDGSSFGYENWHEGMPQDYNGRKELFTIMNLMIPAEVLFVDGTWFNVPGDFQAATICKKNMVEVPEVASPVVTKDSRVCTPVGTFVLYILLPLIVCSCAVSAIFGFLRFRSSTFLKESQDDKVIHHQDEGRMRAANMDKVGAQISQNMNEMPQQLSQPYIVPASNMLHQEGVPLVNNPQGTTILPQSSTLDGSAVNVAC